MGLFSEVYNSCTRFGPEFMGILQTKELRSLLDFYWLSPSGCLYKVDYQGVDLSSGECVARSGSVRPYCVTSVLRLMNIYEGQYKEVFVYFRLGEVQAVLPRGFLLQD